MSLLKIIDTIYLGNAQRLIHLLVEMEIVKFNYPLTESNLQKFDANFIT
jgi:hypothetical protein